MSSIHALRRKIDRMIAALPAPEVTTSRIAFNLALFTPVEQIDLQETLARIEPKITTRAGGLDLHRLTDRELDELGDWLNYHEALQAGELLQARRIKKRLDTPVQQLITTFLELDLSRLPDSGPGVQIEEGNCIYHLSRINYRDVLNHIERGLISCSEIDAMWRWVNYFEQERQAS